MASSLEPLKAPNFDASLLANLPFNILLDLLALSGLLDEGQGSSFNSNGTVEKSESSTNDIKYTGSQKRLDVDSNEARTYNNPSTVRQSNVQDHNKEISDHSNRLSDSSTLLQNTNNVASVLNSKPEITSLVEPVLKVSALKSLTVLLGSNTLLETLTTDVCTESSPLDEEHPQQRLNSLQTLLRSLVSYAVLPSPFQRVVTLRDLERAQSVLIRMASSVHCDKKVAVESKAASEGNTVS